MNKKLLIMGLLLIVSSFMTVVFAADRITVTSDDYFAYYGADTPAGRTHSFAIEVDSNIYYISDSLAEKLASYSYTFRRVYEYDLEKYANVFRPDAISYGSNGFNAYYQLNNQKDNEMFQFANDKTFSFDYKSGQTVGYNKNAKVITKIYEPSGAELTGSY